MAGIKAAKSLLFAILTVCTIGCGNPNNYTTYPQIDAEKETRTLRLYIQEDLSKITVDSISVFCDKVAVLSGNTIVIEPISEKYPIAALDAGGDFAVMSSTTISRGDGNFKIFESPFYFSDYKQLTLTLNGENFLKLIKEIGRAHV